MFSPDETKEREKLAKLIKMLSSPVDGEVLAAARALDRTLKASGHDFHDLADTIISKVMVFKIHDPKDNAALSKNYMEACDWLLKTKIGDKERKFVVDMYNRFKFNPDFRPSQKQAGWFASLVRQSMDEL